ncbi:type II toxin-antitoxin system RelE/ParE family toxin [Solimonas sp. K1W22B-7]|uniref:type II toxin-antitoxin system RelE/ParE family toxin n=1 Tax=Solimonas sp. K1W22B-7 TaxID=2303331 RepID=UPI000E3313A9|nr:type II toxin-antitoxin system RelE/ParE family toxin [Solimonas sp. K1W22B-7]AXQ27173.1 type II toxin-antitoxin system RelE/ParE family toxin [Solimonas sp. K1W22B-7]
MKFSVAVTQDALRDLDELHAYIAGQDGLARADKVLDGVHAALAKLRDLPNRGEYPPELAALGIRDFRQAHFKPYRMIYVVREHSVVILAVIDGRRDMQTLLQRRLLG